MHTLGQCGFNDVPNVTVYALLRPKGGHKVTTRWVMANQTDGSCTSNSSKILLALCPVTPVTSDWQTVATDVLTRHVDSNQHDGIRTKSPLYVCRPSSTPLSSFRSNREHPVPTKLIVVKYPKAFHG